MDDLELIKEEFKHALNFENKASRFEALIQVARLTDSSNIPDFMKKRINERISENQMCISGLLPERDFKSEL